MLAFLREQKVLPSRNRGKDPLVLPDSATEMEVKAFMADKVRNEPRLTDGEHVLKYRYCEEGMGTRYNTAVTSLLADTFHKRLEKGDYEREFNLKFEEETMTHDYLVKQIKQRMYPQFNMYNLKPEERKAAKERVAARKRRHGRREDVSGSVTIVPQYFSDLPPSHMLAIQKARQDSPTFSESKEGS